MKLLLYCCKEPLRNWSHVCGYNLQFENAFFPNKERRMEGTGEGRKEGFTIIVGNPNQTPLTTWVPVTGCMVYTHIQIHCVSWTMRTSSGVGLRGLKDTMMSVVSSREQSQWEVSYEQDVARKRDLPCPSALSSYYMQPVWRDGCGLYWSSLVGTLPFLPLNTVLLFLNSQ